ncbi:MAG: hypothetical protein K0Q79_3480 [Flavipsychrobacter sp.]|jgi:hypothetical protein|nr:hypothetical protein [Flavipsychrobacter sp.]
MRRIAILGAMLLSVCIIQLQAQDKKKKETKKAKEEEKGPVFNYVVDDPMDAFGPKDGAPPAPRFFLYPEFYTYWPVTINDTVLKYECYDANHNPLNMDTLQRLNDVHYINFVKTYNDHLQTFIAQDGSPRPKPVSQKLYWYERAGADLWKAFDNRNNYTSLLQEQVSNIVRADTTILIDPISGNKQMTVRKYYKVVEIEKSNVETLGNNKGENIDPDKTTITSFYVPEFYFHEPKKIKDTTLEFLCYDSRDSLIPVVTNFDSVRYYSLFKKYTDSAHTYNDNGQKKYLPVSVIIKRYDQTSPEKWMSVEYPSNRFTELKGFRSKTIATDTARVYDPATDRTHLNVYNYFKVIKN